MYAMLCYSHAITFGFQILFCEFLICDSTVYEKAHLMTIIFLEKAHLCSATLCYATALLWHVVLRARYRNEIVGNLVDLLCCAKVLV